MGADRKYARTRSNDICSGSSACLFHSFVNTCKSAKQKTLKHRPILLTAIKNKTVNRKFYDKPNNVGVEFGSNM